MSPKSLDERLERITVVVPTYREVENIPLLIERFNTQRRALGNDLDLLIMDDDSRDGSAELVQRLGLPWVRLVTRTGDRGLSQAVLDGLRKARGDVLVVMDADLSHPPEVLRNMLERLRGGADFVVGSRFTAGGTTDDEWGIFRWLNSRIATLMAFPLTRIADPMSGFFMLRRSTFASRSDYNPVGYKIGLELLVKCNCKIVDEVPIHFTDRKLGESKLTFKEQLRYIKHVRRLYAYKFGLWTQLVQFLAVGASGLVVNLLLLTLFLWSGLGVKIAPIPAIFLSMIWNFALNRRFSFSGADRQPVFKQLTAFVSACSFGAVVNYLVTLFVLRFVSSPQLAATVGVAAATGFNFAASRLLVFKQTHLVRK